MHTVPEPEIHTGESEKKPLPFNPEFEKESHYYNDEALMVDLLESDRVHAADVPARYRPAWPPATGYMTRSEFAGWYSFVISTDLTIPPPALGQ